MAIVFIKDPLKVYYRTWNKAIWSVRHTTTLQIIVSMINLFDCDNTDNNELRKCTHVGTEALRELLCQLERYASIVVNYWH